MSTFTGITVEKYKKRFMPDNERSRLEYLDDQLRHIERSVSHLHDAVTQLQDEMALIWTALNALGQTRP